MFYGGQGSPFKQQLWVRTTLIYSSNNFIVNASKNIYFLCIILLLKKKILILLLTRNKPETLWVTQSPKR